MSGIDLSSRISSNDPYHIYYDLNIINNETTGTKRPPFLQFTEIRNSPYLMTPSDYFCSVIRFSLETPTLPLLIPQVKVGSMSVNDLIYSINFTHRTLIPNGIQKFIQYEPQSGPEIPQPSIPTTGSDLFNEYYFTYTYKPFIDMVNKALRDGWTDVLNAISGLRPAPIGVDGYTVNNAPYLYWDEEKNIATFVVPQEIFETPTAQNQNPTYASSLNGEPILLYFNTPLFNLFVSFSAEFNGNNYTDIFSIPTTFGRNFQIKFPNTVTNNPYTITAAGVPQALPVFNSKNCLRVSQEYPSTPLWNPVQSIVFTTSLLPIAPSLVSAPVLYGLGSSLTNSGNNSNISNILTDLEVPLEKGWQTKPSINYTPTAEYRLFDLNGNAPLSAIEISVFWKDSFGQIHPFLLGSGSNSSIKIMFRRKDFQGVI